MPSTSAPSFASGNAVVPTPQARSSTLSPFVIPSRCTSASPLSRIVSAMRVKSPFSQSALFGFTGPFIQRELIALCRASASFTSSFPLHTFQVLLTSALIIHVRSTSSLSLFPSDFPVLLASNFVDGLCCTAAARSGVGHRKNRSGRDEDRAPPRGHHQGHARRQGHHEQGVRRIDDRRPGDHGDALPQRRRRVRLPGDAAH